MTQTIGKGDIYEIERIWCAHSANWAHKVWDQSPKPIPQAERIHHSIPFLAKDGCILEPHLRPICTIHACQIARRGYFVNKQTNRRYWQLNDELTRLEMQRAKARKIDLTSVMIGGM
jgi:murein endopeptidase